MQTIMLARTTSANGQCFIYYLALSELKYNTIFYSFNTLLYSVLQSPVFDLLFFIMYTTCSVLSFYLFLKKLYSFSTHLTEYSGQLFKRRCTG